MTTTLRYRDTLRNHDVVAYTISHLLAVIAEWAVFIGVLVYANDHGGATTAGLASIGLIVPYVLLAPFTGGLADRYSPWLVRVVGLAAQALGYAAAAIAAWMSAPPIVVVVGAMVAVTAVTTLRPAGAVLLPAIVRTSRELTVANLWQGYCDSCSAFGAPLLATGLLIVGGAPAVITGSAVATALALLACLVRGPVHHATAPGAERISTTAILRNQVDVIRAHHGIGGVLAVAGGQWVLLGGLDLLTVIIASEQLGMGASGPGVLSVAFGFGAFLGIPIMTRLSTRSRLAPVLIACMALTAVAVALLGVVLTLAMALITLPLLGLMRSTIDALSRMLLQRSAPPEELGALFAVVEVVGGIGLIVGSLMTQVLIASGGADVALIGLGIAFVVLMLTTFGSLRHADASADIPVVAISLLRRLPVFAPLPPWELEAVARAADEVHTAPGELVVAQGDVGDLFFAVADGHYDVTIDARPIRTIERGGSFGEIALLADVPRTATVTSREHGSLLAVGRRPFLVAVTGHESARQAAWGAVRTMESAVDVPDDIGDPIG